MFITTSTSLRPDEEDIQHEKRARLNLPAEDINNQSHGPVNQSLVLLSLPVEIIELALHSLGARDLLNVRRTNRSLSSIAMKVARNACMVHASSDEQLASRWR